MHRAADERPSDWEGPAWAAPEDARRIASRPVIDGDTYGTALLRILSYGQIDVNMFKHLRQEARRYQEEMQQ
jgi:hypothetical protein